MPMEQQAAGTKTCAAQAAAGKTQRAQETSPAARRTEKQASSKKRGPFLKKGGRGDDLPDEGRMSLLNHLKELRRRLIVCVAAFLIAFSGCLSQAEWFTNHLLEQGRYFSFVYIAPAELLMSYINVAFVGGIVVAVPVIAYEIWRFVRPGLKRRERIGFVAIMLVGLVLFALGAAFSFAIVLPILLSFFARLNTTGTVQAMVSVQSYIGYLLSTMVTFGVIFETPIVLVSITGIGLVKPSTLQKNFKYVILIILTVAAIITPPDVTSQILVAVPLVVLFYASIILCKIVFRRKLKREAEEATA